MLAFICDWCGNAYVDYPLFEHGTTLASNFKLKKPKSDYPDVEEIPIGTKVITEGWTCSDSDHISSMVSKHVCRDCFNAYKEFVVSRKKKV